jgi:hypothetical protein
MRTLLLLASLACSGCITIEKLDDVGGRSVGSTYGRAYFLKKGPTGSTVMVCDARPGGTSVICYDSRRSPN